MKYLLILLLLAATAHAGWFTRDTPEECIQKYISQAKTNTAARLISNACRRYPNGGTESYQKNWFDCVTKDVAKAESENGARILFYIKCKKPYEQKQRGKYNDLFPDKKTPPVKQTTGLFDDLIAQDGLINSTQKTSPPKMMSEPQFYAILDNLAPSWQTFNTNTGFKNYLANNTHDGKPLSQVIKELYNRFDASGVARIFNGYAKHNRFAAMHQEEAKKKIIKKQGAVLDN